MIDLDFASVVIYLKWHTTCMFMYQLSYILNADWKKAVRAMSILGLLVLSVAVFMTVLKLFVMKDKKPVLFAGIGTSFAGGKIYISTCILDILKYLNNLIYTKHSIRSVCKINIGCYIIIIHTCKMNLSCISGIFILIAVAVFAAKQNDELANVDFTYHFAFAFSIIAMITAFAAGGVMLFSMTKE